MLSVIPAKAGTQGKRRLRKVIPKIAPLRILALDEPPVRVLPIAGSLRQVASWDAGAVSIKNRLDESAIIPRRGADIADFPRQQVLYPLPLIITQSISGHGSAFLQPTFDNSH
jgi:hypothetical protein